MKRRLRRRPTIEALEDRSMFAGVEVDMDATAAEIIALESGGASLTEAVYAAQTGGVAQPTTNPDGASIQLSPLLDLANDYNPASSATPVSDDSLPSQCPEATDSDASATIVGIHGNLVQIATPNGEVTATSTAGDVTVSVSEGVVQVDTPQGPQDQHLTVNTSNSDGETTSESIYLPSSE